jgi:diguanylate cyclase (GGDEF)-like protein
VSDQEIQDRKELFDISVRDEAALRACLPVVSEIADAVIWEYFDGLLQVPEVTRIITDGEVLMRLRATMRSYLLSMFSGDYERSYVDSRLKIGRIHARIGLLPKVYISALHGLEEIVSGRLRDAGATPQALRSLRKMFMFDLQFFFDTYVQSLVGQVDAAREELEGYTQTLEQIVAERTEEVTRLAQIDQLTGLPNRKAFHEALQHDLRRAHAVSRPVALAFIDLDGFKGVNDSLGHVAGDKILQRFGEKLRSNLRAGEQAFRYGGDEFCVIMNDTDGVGADQACSRIADTLPSCCATVGMSWGIAVQSPGTILDPEHMVRLADQAMYQRKAAKPTRPHALARSA